MTLTFSNTILDEEFRATQTGTADDDDRSAPVAADPIKAAIDDLALNFFSAPTGFPQWAEQTNFVTDSNDPVVTNYKLVANSDGDAFPATGTATTLFVGSNQIFLFPTSNEDIIVGRVGNGTTADSTGDVVLVIGVEETKSSGFVTQADMWLGLYSPLIHDGADLVDSADTLDLSNLVYLSSTFDTTTEVPFESFLGVPSGNNLFNVIFPSDATAGDVQLLLTGSTGETLSTVNVSSTGIGAGSQHIDVGYTLRIDTVSGMDQDMVNSAPEVNNSGNIDYTGRVELAGADFEITQLNPGSTPERADLKISAFNAAGASQEGAYLTNAIATDGVAVTIDVEDVIVLNGAGQDITASLNITQDGDSVIIRGLDDGTSASKTDGYQVFFTTDGVKFDRFLITNVDSSTTFDVGNIHVTAVEGGIDEEIAELGSHLIYQDDGPKITGNAASLSALTSDDTTFATDPSASFAGAFTTDAGADTPGAVAYTLGVTLSGGAAPNSGLVDTATGDAIFLFLEGGIVKGRSGDNATLAASGPVVFEISVDSNGVVKLDQKSAVFHTDSNDFDSTSSAMAAGLITLTANISDGEPNATDDSASASINIGNLFRFKDDGPSLTQQADPAGNNLFVDNNLSDAADSTDTSSYGLVPGADGTKSYTIVGGPDTTGDFRWAYTNAGNTAIKGTVADEDGVFHDLYTLVLNANGSYVFTMIGTLPGSEIDLDVNDIKAGGPNSNSIIVGATGSDPRSIEIAGTGGPINESNDNVGVTNGNLDTGEALTFFLLAADGTTHLSFQGLSIGTKTAQGGTYNYSATPVGGGAAITGSIPVAKNQPIVIDPALLGNVLIDSITITKASGSTTKIGLDDISIFVPPNDVQLGFTVELKDGDNDTTTQNFTVDIDGNNDGVFSATVNSLSLPLENSTLSVIETLHHQELAGVHDAFAF